MTKDELHYILDHHGLKMTANEGSFSNKQFRTKAIVDYKTRTVVISNNNYPFLDMTLRYKYPSVSFEDFDRYVFYMHTIIREKTLK